MDGNKVDLNAEDFYLVQIMEVCSHTRTVKVISPVVWNQLISVTKLLYTIYLYWRQFSFFCLCSRYVQEQRIQLAIFDEIQLVVEWIKPKTPLSERP